MKIFVEIPIGTFFSEVFPFWRFAIDNHVFRVFVEVPIGIILALFDHFSATIRGGVDLLTAWHCWEFFFWRPNFLGYHFPDIKNGFQVENIGSHYQSKNWLFWKNHIFFVENFPNHIINCKYGIFFDCFFVIFLVFF